jgi:hypothetical protein
MTKFGNVYLGFSVDVIERLNRLRQPSHASYGRTGAAA